MKLGRRNTPHYKDVGLTVREMDINMLRVLAHLLNHKHESVGLVANTPRVQKKIGMSKLKLLEKRGIVIFTDRKKGVVKFTRRGLRYAESMLSSVQVDYLSRPQPPNVDPPAPAPIASARGGHLRPVK